MYALIGCKEGSDEPVLLNTARTLKAAQKKMAKVQDDMGLTQWKQPGTQPYYKFLGFLTAEGLVNYHGNRIPNSSLGSITMKVEY